MPNHPLPRATQLQKHDQIRTLRVLVLAFSAFIFNTTEFVPVALLSDIGASFDKSVSQVGVMMTVYAWIVAVMSLPAMLATAHIARKKLLLGLFGLFVASHVLTVIAHNFTVLLIARAGVALAHAVFWSITASLVVRVAPKGRQTWALGLLATGSALATVLGLPLGRILGQYLSWRATFGVIGGLALICMVLLAMILPKLPSRDAGDLKSLPKIINNKPLLIVYALIALMVTAHFTAYSYIEPFILTIAHFNANYATIVLLLFGMAGIISSWLFGRYYDKYPKPFLIIAFIAVLACLSSMLLFAKTPLSWAILCMTWGIGMTAVSLALQLRTLKLASKETDVAMSLFSGIYNVGIGGGALIGGLVISHVGLSYIGIVGAMIAFLAMLICVQFYIKDNS